MSQKMASLKISLKFKMFATYVNVITSRFQCVNKSSKIPPKSETNFQSQNCLK